MRGRARDVVALALAAWAATACGDGLTETEREVAGGYVLTAINGVDLPFALGRPCGEEVTNGYLELGQGSRFYVETTVRNTECPEENRTENWAGSGIWTVIDGEVRMVSDAGIQGVTFGTAPAAVIGDLIRPTGRFEVLGYEGDPIRPSLTPVQVTFTFSR